MLVILWASMSVVLDLHKSFLTSLVLITLLLYINSWVEGPNFKMSNHVMNKVRTAFSTMTLNLSKSLTILSGKPILIMASLIGKREVNKLP